MNGTLALAILMAAFGAGDDDVPASIVAGGYKSVGVCPRAICKQGAQESVPGTLGPMSQMLSDRLYDSLVAASAGKYRGQFSVKNDDVVRRAFDSVATEDLDSPTALRMLAAAAGIDALAVVTSVDTPGELQNKVKLIDLRDGDRLGDIGGLSKDSFDKTLSDAAYMGQSFEIRRWTNGALQNVGLNLDGSLAFGASFDDEVRQQKNLKAAGESTSPLASSDCPYRIAVVVNGQQRQLEEIGGKFFVRLERGEEYAVSLWNKSEKPAYFAVYIDGVNSISRDPSRRGLEHPLDTDTLRHWYLAANSGERRIDGWYTVDRSRNLETTESFRVVTGSESVAAGENMLSNLGMITAVVYTVGMDQVPQGPQMARKGLSPGYLGTGKGTKSDVRMADGERTPRGVMLAAMTIYYRTGDELAQLRRGAASTVAVTDTGKREDAVASNRPATFDSNKPDVVGSGELSGKEIYRRGLVGTAWVCIFFKDHYVSGTGWVLDRDRKLLVTNHHVVAGAESAKVFFPAYRNGRAISDRNYYLEQVSTKAIPAKVFISDPKRDLAVLQLETIPDGVEALALDPDGASPGEMLYSIGNPGAVESLWAYTVGVTRQIGHLHTKYDTGQVVDVDVVESQSPTNHGDSGGPVFGENGKLVAVVSSGNTAAQAVSNFIELGEVRGMVDEVSDTLDPRTAAQFTRRAVRMRLMGREDEALRNVNSALELDPRFADAYAERGFWSYAKGQYDAARADCDKAIELNAKTAAAYNTRALLNLHFKRNQEAVSDADKAIALNPKDATLYNNRAIGYENLGNAAAALADLRMATKLDRFNAFAWCNLGDLHASQNRVDEAISAFSMSVQANPHYERAYVELGRFLASHWSPEQAINVFTNEINNNPTSSLAHIERARVYFRMGQFARVWQDADAALKLDSRSAPALQIRATAQSVWGMYDSALEDIRRAIGIEPANKSYRDDLAYIYCLSGKYQDAIDTATETIRSDANSADAYRWRAIAQGSLGNDKLAQADLARFRELSPAMKEASLNTQRTKLFSVTNMSSEPVEVYAVFYTKLNDAAWKWCPDLPQANDPLVVRLDPLTTSTFRYQGVVMHGQKMRLWFRGASGGTDKYKDVDLEICSEDGYIDTGLRHFGYRYLTD